MRGTLLGLTAIFLFGAIARADPAPAPPPAHAYADETAALPESRLVPADEWRAPPPNWNGDIADTTAPWVLRHEEERRHFLTPLVLPSVFPEVAVRLDNVAGYHRAAAATDFDQLALLSLYYVDVYAPLLTLRDSASVSPDSFRVNLKAPWIIGRRQAVTLFFGGDVPVKGRLVDGGYDSMLGYAAKIGPFSGQARAGVGVERLLANARAPFSPSFLYDAALAYRPLGWLEVMAQVDGLSVIGADRASVRLWPAVRFYPSPDRALSLAVGGLFWFDEASGSWATHRTGGIIDAGYDFL